MPSERKFKESIFNYTVRKNNLTYVFNTLHSSFLVHDKEERLISDNISPDLIKNGFVVEKDYDELEYLKKVRFSASNNQRKFFYRIMTTGLCNANCAYCFEKNIKKEAMSIQTAKDTVSFIKKRIENGYKSLTLEWFGGEPLLNIEVIDTISKELNNSNIKYRSRIITNGSLITENIAQKMKDDWKIQSAQITLDGTSENYKRIKNYATRKYDLDQIIKNIIILLKKNIFVSIRLSVDKRSFDDCKILLKQLDAILFDYRGQYNIYPGFLFECFDENNKTVLNENDEKMVYEFQTYLNSYGYNYSILGRKVKKNACHACNINSFYITTSGDLFKCSEQHAIDPSNPLASIYNFDTTVISQLEWINGEIDEKCSKCVCLPYCQGGCHVAKLYSTPMRRCFSSKFALEKKVNSLIERFRLSKQMDFVKKILKTKVFLTEEDIEDKIQPLNIEKLPDEIFEVSDDHKLLTFYYYSKMCPPVLNKKNLDQYIITHKIDATNNRHDVYLNSFREILNMCHKQFDISYDYYEALFETAMEIGICQYIAGNNTNTRDVIYKIVKKLKKWSLKTYEGKRVPFGLIINNTQSAKVALDYTDFLDSNFSALLSDGIFSAMELDKNGSFLTYLSIEDEVKQNQKETSKERILSPLSYTHFSSLCYGQDKFGVILNERGNILLIKTQQITFSYRNGNWIHYEFNLFYEDVYHHLYEPQKSKYKNAYKFLKEIYVSILDMIFSGEGCCIAILRDDVLLDFENVYEPINVKNEKKRIEQKKEFLRKCIQIDDESTNATEPKIKNRKFENLSRKLRQELLSYDGALILNQSGEFQAIGEIVNVDGNSSDGGGRTKAAQSLAKGGIGIKVSEDGYIECYGDSKEEKDGFKKIFELK